MSKDEVKQLIADKKSAAGQVFDDISAAVDSIDVSSDPDLQKKLDDALQMISDDEAKLQADDAQVAALQDKLAKIKALLEG